MHVERHAVEDVNAFGQFGEIVLIGGCQRVGCFAEAKVETLFKVDGDGAGDRGDGPAAFQLFDRRSAFRRPGPAFHFPPPRQAVPQFVHLMQSQNSQGADQQSGDDAARRQQAGAGEMQRTWRQGHRLTNDRFRRAPFDYDENNQQDGCKNDKPP